MPAGDERKSVYEKALIVFRKGEQTLNSINKELEEHKLQSYIDYRLEERKLRKELIGLRQEQNRLAKEAFKRHRAKRTVDDIAKELKTSNRTFNHERIKLDKKIKRPPQINCTQSNIPRILQRSLSHESEFYTWTFGLPKLPMKKTLSLSGGLDQVYTSSMDKKQKNVSSKLGKLQHKDSNAHEVVYSIPYENKDSITGATKLPSLLSRAKEDEGRSGKRTLKTELPKLPDIKLN